MGDLPFMTLRFVLLEHRRDGVHYDLMLETEPGGPLRTWAIDGPVVAGKDLPARGCRTTGRSTSTMKARSRAVAATYGGSIGGSISAWSGPMSGPACGLREISSWGGGVAQDGR